MNRMSQAQDFFVKLFHFVQPRLFGSLQIDYEISGHSFPFFCIEEFNPKHETQWESKLSPF